MASDVYDEFDAEAPEQQGSSVTSILGLPINRFVAFVGPYISLGAGVVASWLLVHVHFLGLFHFQHDGLTSWIAQAVVFLVTALLSWAGHSKWLSGHQMWEQATLAHAGKADPALGGLPATDQSVQMAQGAEHPDGAEYNEADFQPPIPPGL